MDSKIDHVFHVWINERCPIGPDTDQPCQWCGKSYDEHGNPGASPLAKSRKDRLCPVNGVTSQFYTPKIPKQDVTRPPMRTLYAWKSAIQFMEYAPKAIKKAMEKQLPQVHQQCSHTTPVPIKDNEVLCWLGQNVAKCPILADLQATFDRERQRTYPDGRPSYYADITQDDVYRVMGYVCTWHLLMSDVATKDNELPPGSFVDWNEGAFQDKSDRMFWSNVYKSLSQGIGYESAQPEPGGEGG